jgi:hypothetical protein
MQAMLRVLLLNRPSFHVLVHGPAHEPAHRRGTGTRGQVSATTSSTEVARGTPSVWRLPLPDTHGRNRCARPTLTATASRMGWSSVSLTSFVIY